MGWNIFVCQILRKLTTFFSPFKYSAEIFIFSTISVFEKSAFSCTQNIWLPDHLNTEYMCVYFERTHYKKGNSWLEGD